MPLWFWDEEALIWHIMLNAIPDHVRDFLKERFVDQFERAMYGSHPRPSMAETLTYEALVSPRIIRFMSFDPLGGLWDVVNNRELRITNRS
jgi:hypothetical protein